MKPYRLAVLITLALALLLAGACRSRVKPAAAPALPAEPVARTVEAPDRDFVRPAAEPRDDMSSAELNRVARERGWIRDAFFEFDSNTLNGDARAALETSSRWLKQNPGVRLVVEGHCDERGTEQYNLALGDRRAHSAREYLAALGVDPARVDQISYGEERPFATGSTEAAWQQNRRAHLRLEQQ